MKNSNSTLLLKTCLVIAMVALLVCGLSVRADDYVRYKARPVGSTVRIDGKANVHDWDMEGTIIGGYIEVPAGVTLDSTQAEVPGSKDGKIALHADVRIPVTSVKNSHFDGMNEVMQDAMKAKDFPAIEYHLTDFAIKLPHAAGTPFQCDAKGDLAVHGVTNKISMPVTIETMDKTKLKIVGTAIPLKMTDFGIKPPVKAAIFTTDDEVKITFEFVAALPTKAK